MKLDSRVFPTWERLYAVLAAPGVFTPHPITGEFPLVIFGDVDGTFFQIPGEAIIVVGVPINQPAEAMATYGQNISADEDFDLQVIVRTMIPGQTRAETFARLKDLVAAARGTVRDITTGKPAGNFTDADPGPQCLWWEITKTAPQLGPIGSEGFGSMCDLTVHFHARL